MTFKSKTKEYQKVYNKEWNSRPEVKAKRKAYKQIPNIKEKNRLYKKEYRQRKKEDILKYNQSPKVKAYFKEYAQRPEVIKKRRQYNKKRSQKRKEEYIKKYGNIKKSCIICNKLFKPKSSQKTCSEECYKENKRKKKENVIRQNRTPESKAKQKALQQTPKYKKMKKEYMKQRRKKDKGFATEGNLRTLFYIAFKLYSKTGKVMNSKKYGVDFKKIIQHIGDKPDDGRVYELDHIIPLCKFNHDDPKQVKKAWAPENCQWLTKEINRWKNNRLIKPLTDEQKEKLQKQLENSVTDKI